MTDQEAPCFPNRFSPFTASRAALAIPIELQKREQASSDPHRIMVEPPAHLYPTVLHPTTSTCRSSSDKFMHWNVIPYKVLGNEIYPKYFCQHYLKELYTLTDNGYLITASMAVMALLFVPVPIHMFCPLCLPVGSHQLAKLQTISLPPMNNDVYLPEW